MASEGILQFSVASVVGDVLLQHGKKLHAIDLDSRKANEDCMTKLSFFIYVYVYPNVLYEYWYINYEDVDLIYFNLLSFINSTIF